ncbi:MAG: hypothetical protein A4E74_01528 [Syntrophus sp. PtaB.Bin075]|nr:MAG: hypothetical protein A4E74_01528 [Syntrophus sp. PtaB.Bin075]
MSKKQTKLDPNQHSFDFDTPIQEYETLRVKLLAGPDKPQRVENYEEACIEIAATVKRAIRTWGGSREEMVEAINAYFCSSEKSKRLSIHMLNHYLSKPTEYPMPAVLIYAIQHITGSLETVATLAQAEEARVISGEEVRKLAIGKLDDAIAEMQRLKKEFRGIRK